ncbi:hypothetical protein FB45DRAFT_1101459 [Roridomyces roridus]|uniref:Uncharacterized protein n=1 Tax=Roridomyces roridus TaxID=1738132 RepID=A0AAD7CFX1_9AGAR|nr:hypothetical protein FB45DRAFT_1101459 [Roridomyces roridus]
MLITPSVSSSSATTKDDHHALEYIISPYESLTHLLRASAAADMTFDRLLPQGSDCTSLEKMKLHQPPTPACAPNTLNLSPKHPGTTGARGPSSGTSDVVDHLKASPRYSFKPCRVQVLAAGMEVPTPREGFKTARGPPGFDVLRSTLLQVAPRLAAPIAASLAGAVDIVLDGVGLGW